MSKLYQIKKDVQQVAAAIASVLGVEVTITDDALYRVAGTGCYAGNMGNAPIKASLFVQVLQTGAGVIIDDPGENSVCLRCESRQYCTELAQVCCPIQSGEATIGVIALVAFTPEQKQALLARRHDLLDFLGRMADLLASKVVEQERMAELKGMKNQLETLLNTVQEGIIAMDTAGRIIDTNTAAAKMIGVAADKLIGTNIVRVFAGLTIEDLLERSRKSGTGEIPCWLQGRRLHCIMKFNTWSDAAEVKGIVATLQEMETVKKIVSRYGWEIDCRADEILGGSTAMENVKQAVSMAARTNTAVLIRGESGTGKELLARVLHCSSERRYKPFIAINCAAIPDTLLETELFGYEEGAFTGARRGGKPGKFELADGGTLFLDEIGDMPLPLQAKLLRVLQEKQIERIGGTQPVPVDVRIISATHKDIEAMIKAGQFRQDLYYRINVFPVVVPPLRQRREDLPVLISHFLEKYQTAYAKRLAGMDTGAYNLLLQYEWPGNVRELENIIEYLVSIETGSRISLPHVMDRIQRSGEAAPGDMMSIAAAERQLILAAMAKFGPALEGKEKAAAALGISKATLYRKLKEYARD
ncbi:pas fold [Lucifera butyrica]|uniref:Pas fold n=1 Tax=Lucifera butyrica TaxID=1351585 RepID=A0A498R9V7_9FIRM|nr:sigma 54-interacting transcriptional regulator [Lucifera butyrica]VBB07062.1 pas fold [Lucifera butyrica]